MTDSWDERYFYRHLVDVYGKCIRDGPPKPTVLEVFMVNNLVFRWLYFS